MAKSKPPRDSAAAGGSPASRPARTSQPKSANPKPQTKSEDKPKNGGKGNGPSPMDLPLLQKLVKLMADNDLSGMELRDGNKRILLRRGAEPSAAAPAAYAPPPAQMPTSPAATHAAPPPATASAAVDSADDTAGMVEIKSPMVGTFYAAPSPEAPAFVNVGDRVGPDTDVCIIEAMKVFNNIKAETSGTIAKILVSSGTAVEYGQPLFLVKPA